MAGCWADFCLLSWYAGNPTLLSARDLFAPGIVHAFLFRDPAEVVRSFHTVNMRSGPCWERFQPWEIGYHELRVFYDFVCENVSYKPILVDSDDLIQNPTEVLKALCEAGGLRFDQCMLNWKSTEDRAAKIFEKFAIARESDECLGGHCQLTPKSSWTCR